MKEMSRHFRSVMKIVKSSPELRRKITPHINQQREEINWSAIWRTDFGSGHLAALYFAHAIWREDVTAVEDPFCLAHSMDDDLSRTVHRAIGIWLGVEP